MDVSQELLRGYASAKKAAGDTAAGVAGAIGSELLAQFEAGEIDQIQFRDIYLERVYNEAIVGPEGAALQLAQAMIETTTDGVATTDYDIISFEDFKANSDKYWAKVEGKENAVELYQQGMQTAVKKIVGKAADRATASAHRKQVKGKREKGELKWARVPVGPTCEFCILLASRGYIYESKMSAKYKDEMMHKYHDDCDCSVVCINYADEVERYAYKEYLAHYEDARNAIAPMYGDAQIPTNAILQEMRTRTREWNYDGTPSEVKISGEPNPDEQWVLDLLSNHGVRGLGFKRDELIVDDEHVDFGFVGNRNSVIVIDDDELDYVIRNTAAALQEGQTVTIITRSGSLYRLRIYTEKSDS